jgi:hypothetical protein
VIPLGVRVIQARLAFAVSGILLLSGCSSAAGLSADEMARLDSLDATGVVRAYFEAGASAANAYLSTPEERERRAQDNFVPDGERAGDIMDLSIEGGDSVGAPLEGYERYSDQRQFRVSYSSRRRSSIGEPPGPRGFFVYAGRSPDGGTWKVLSVGTGP